MEITSKPFNPDDPLPILLLRSRNALLAHFKPTLRRHDLSEQQWRILRCLSFKDMADISEIAEMADLLHSSVSRMLTELERRSLILRVTPKKDARRCLVLLAPDGRALVTQMRREIQGIHDAIDMRIGPETAGALRRALVALIQEMESGELLTIPPVQGLDT